MSKWNWTAGDILHHTKQLATRNSEEVDEKPTGSAHHAIPKVDKKLTGSAHHVIPEHPEEVDEKTEWNSPTDEQPTKRILLRNTQSSPLPDKMTD